ncbi:MAG: cytochrome c3 family protein [Gammaproteobacteria bacterium]|nr:cytochrome c3 family protein [Gammaproteobacteria bacterium]
MHITNDWMPLARFSHDSHKNMRCEGCHQASDSTAAADVLMPDIGGCRSCHGGEDSVGRLQSTCVTCHEFHLDSEGPMGELIPVEQLESEQAAIARQVKSEAEQQP